MLSIQEKIVKAAEGLAAHPAQEDVLIGFDGFIDEIIRLVDTRASAEEYTPMATMTVFAERILAAAGLSCNIEMVPTQVKLGGNGPIMANSLVAQGYGVRYIGALGAGGAVHPVFHDFAEACLEVISLCSPAQTNALEFDDGKIMMGKMDMLREVNWESLLAQMPMDALQERINATSLVGCVNWTMLPNMNSILQGLSALLKNRPGRARLFIDLTDPKKRSAEDIREVLCILSGIQEHADVTLGLNEYESNQVSEALLGHASDDLTDRAQKIRTKMGIDQVVIHPTRSAAVATSEGEWYVEGPYTPKPKLTTGAGDNFNAGYCNGMLAGLDPESCLLAGVGNSGFYVRQCHSPSRPELVDFLRTWSAAGGGEMA